MVQLLIYTLMLVGLPSALSRGVFAMTAESAAMYMPAVINILEGNVTADAPGRNVEGAMKPKCIDASNGDVFDVFVPDGWGGYIYKGFENAPKGSVAVIPITDAIMKYDYCGAYGTKSIAAFIKDAVASKNVVGVLLDMDTPGGEVYGTKNLSDVIGASTKPVVTHISDGYCASAGMYIASKSNKILMHQPTDKVGSIGVYTTLIDPRGAYEAKGFKVKTIYSPTSPEKNAAWIEAMEKDNDKPMKADLAYLDKVFMDQVRNGRGAKLNEDALKGGMYYTDEAIEMGLCDGYATFEQAIEEVINLSKGSLTIG
jgi:ClpP class serine protease